MSQRRKRSAAPASITAVAERAGVSIATVSRIVNGVQRKASAATTAKVRRAIADLDYRPASAGRTLRQGQSRLVAVLAANLANPAMATVAASIELALRELQLVMVLCDTHELAALQDEYVREMRAQSVRAIVMLAVVPSPGLAEAHGAGLPFVFVNRRPPAHVPGPFVGIDNAVAAAEVGGYVLRMHCRSIGVIHGPLNSSATADRVRGFRSFARSHTLALPAARVVTFPGHDHLQIGYEGMARLLAQDPDIKGVFCSSDLIAFGAHRRVLEGGRRVPQDTLIVGFDDSPLNDWVAPWLSSVRVPYSAFGAAVADLIAGLSTGLPGADRILRHTLIARG